METLFQLISFLIKEYNIDNLFHETFDVFKARLMSHTDRQFFFQTNLYKLR